MHDSPEKSAADLLRENADLQAKLAEYEALLAAIRHGEVDGIMLSDVDKQRLTGLDQSEYIYRRLVEEMGEGAITLSSAGIVLYANQYLAKMLQAPLNTIIGSRIDEWLRSSAEAEPIHAYLRKLSAGQSTKSFRGEHRLRTRTGAPIAVYIALTSGPEVEDGQCVFNMIVTDLTEQKRNEAIAANERLAHAILDQVADAIVVCDPDGIVIRASASAWHLCGRNPIGNPFEQCFPLSDESGRRYSEKEIIALDRRTASEQTFFHLDRHLELQVSAVVLQDPEHDRMPLGSVISLTDITYIKQAERNAIIAQEQLEKQLELAKRARRSLLSLVEDVKASDERLRRIASLLPGMVYQYQRFTDGTQALPFASSAIETIFRISADAVRQDASRLFEIIHPDDRESAKESMRISGDVLSPWKHEFRVKYEDGVIRWLFADASPQQQDDGSILWHGFISDITERKSTEAKVKLAANVFRQSREGIFITDAENRIVMINDAFTLITGYSETEALGENPRLLSSGRQSRRFYHDMWQVIDANGYWEGEIWNRHKDGTVFPEWLSVTRTYDDIGRCTGYIGIFDDITQRKEHEQHIQWLAHYDHLTELPNRTLLRDRIQNAIRMASRVGKRIAVLFCDLDHFKNVNDALGHNVGDLLLKEVARRMQTTIRNIDTVSRQGGDEFIILLPESDADGAAHVAEKIQNAINLPYDINGFEMTISISIGISIFPKDGDDFDRLAKNADIAMYRAKAIGRNNYCFYSEEMEKSTARSLKLEKDIHSAIGSDELEVYYQPQVSLNDGRITGVEALLRWNHPEFGTVSPFEFIPIAENSGEILRIGEWVTLTATRQVKAWLANGMKPIRLSVNLSVRELRRPLLLEKLKSILDEVGYDPHHLELEITESMLMEDQENVIKTLHGIHDMGVHLSIDDFGTGYSSLSYLKRLPVDQLKIDKTFVQDMLTDPGDAIIACSIITLGHSLGLNVIAEGVETPGQLEFLLANHCDNIQGYLFSGPMPADRIMHMLAMDERLSILPV
ncbi:MAG: EAL domain-containing protein [Candidatus Thiodiazotropha sp.]